MAWSPRPRRGLSGLWLYPPRQALVPMSEPAMVFPPIVIPTPRRPSGRWNNWPGIRNPEDGLYPSRPGMGIDLCQQSDSYPRTAGGRHPFVSLLTPPPRLTQINADQGLTPER